MLSISIFKTVHTSEEEEQFGQRYYPNSQSQSQAKRKKKRKTLHYSPQPRQKYSNKHHRSGPYKDKEVEVELDNHTVSTQSSHQSRSDSDIPSNLHPYTSNVNFNMSNENKKARPSIPNNYLPLIKDAINDKAWRVSQFVSDSKQALDYAQNVLASSGINEFKGDSPQAIQNRDTFSNNHSNEIAKLLNQKRSNIISKLKDVVEEYWRSHKKKKMPSLDELLKIIRREEDVDEALFMWWWSRVLPNVVGNCSHWNEKIFYYTKICTHKDNDPKKTPFVTPALEAFAFIVIENNHKK